MQVVKLKIPNKKSPIRNSGLNGAAVIDSQGKEIPITEQMILDACDKLHKMWRFPKQSS